MIILPSLFNYDRTADSQLGKCDRYLLWAQGRSGTVSWNGACFNETEMEEETMRRSSSLSVRAARSVLLVLFAAPAALAQQPIKVGIVTLLSGPAAGPF